MTDFFEGLAVGRQIDGPSFAVSRESIRAFCEASLDFNPLHLDDGYMQGSFGKTRFDGIIMHGMNNFGLITRMLTDWAYPVGGVHRRLETRWLMPVKPGDLIRPRGTVAAVQTTAKSRWVTVAVEVFNQRDEVVAKGEALLEFPAVLAAAS
jgi:acyl dehydratase